MNGLAEMFEGAQQDAHILTAGTDDLKEGFDGMVGWQADPTKA